LEKTIPFVHFPNVFHRYRIAGDATAAVTQGQNTKSPQERYKILFLSISPEPDT